MMKVEGITTVPVDPVRVKGTGVGSVAIAQESTGRNREIEQPRRILQKDTRSAEEVQKDLDVINSQLRSMNRSIQFSIDKGTHDIIVKVVDKESGEVIRQLPPESIIKLRERMADIAGLIVEENV